MNKWLYLSLNLLGLVLIFGSIVLRYWTAYIDLCNILNISGWFVLLVMNILLLIGRWRDKK